jgi:hypothetical protein
MTMTDHIGREETLEEFRRRNGAAPEVADTVLRKPATIKNVMDLLGAAAPVLKEAITDATRPLLERLDALERRLTEIESRPQLKYFGIWRAHKYTEGAFVTDNGSVWHANRTTTERPGTSADWTLAVKHGREGRADR